VIACQAIALMQQQNSGLKNGNAPGDMFKTGRSE